MSHTPGPWHWSDRYLMVGSGERTWSLIGDDGYGILSCNGVENSPQGLNDVANARLISYAPDLLESLKELQKFYSKIWDRVDGGIFLMEEHVDAFEKAVEKASTAIAKATGESHEA